MSGLWVEMAIILGLIVANGFFAASEIAIVSARKSRLEQQAAAGRHGATVAIELSENPNRFLSTVQVGITLIGTLAAAFGGERIAGRLATQLRQTFPGVDPYAEGLALVLVVAVISYLSLIIGELVPKRLALQSAEIVAAAVAPAMRTVARVTSPLVAVLTRSTEFVLWVLRRHEPVANTVTEDDILALVREGQEDGTVEAAEHDLISNVFTFTDRTVRSLMTPRTRMVAIEIDTPLPQVMRTVIDSGYSRIPVYEQTLDQVIGMLYAKDLLRAYAHPDQVNLRAILRPPLYVPESQRAVVAFQQLKQKHTPIALVLDEYGQVAGLISMEDMLEELVGDISDEYDEIAEHIVRREDGSFLVDGLLPFDDLRLRLGLPSAETLEREHNFETVAGFILAVLGRIPSVGDTLLWEGYRFEIVDMDGRRIDRILLRPPSV